MIGLLAWNAASQLLFGLPRAFARVDLLIYAALGLLAMRGPARVRRAAWAVLALLAACLVVVVYTPLAPALFQRLVLDEEPAPADLIVVLSAGTYATSLSDASTERLLRGLELYAAGWAPQIVFTGDPADDRNQFHQMAPRQTAALGLSTAGVVPFESVEAPRKTTYTEALSIRKMAAARGWQSILLVTSPSHTRRSAEVFQMAGLQVRVVASASIRYDTVAPKGARPRLHMFRDWVYEELAALLYRVRGRL